VAAVWLDLAGAPPPRPHSQQSLDAAMADTLKNHVCEPGGAHHHVLVIHCYRCSNPGLQVSYADGVLSLVCVDCDLLILTVSVEKAGGGETVLPL
jgi:hypothetical protein